MDNKVTQTLILLAILLWIGACQVSQTDTPPSPPTFTVEPTPTPIRLPPNVTATPTSEPTPTNTAVVQASYTPKPPADTPTPAPEPTQTPTLLPETSPEVPLPGRASRIDWEDTDGQPFIVAGQDEGYFIWTDGDKVFIRAATKGERYTFSGQATGDGAIVNVNWLTQEPMQINIGEAVNRLDFQWAATGGPEGLDFSFTGDTLWLNLNIKSETDLEPSLVFVGEDKRSLNSMSLQLVR
ncbi:MAG: hypothetical protein JXM69_07425 [Anaerolineae bacterium]|nr:hypothetical protein [Anaerolineae bacterium]